MSTTLDELLAYIDTTLEPGRFRDYCPNGLQVQGRDKVTRIASGVTANQALLDAAIEWGADAILVHHGYFWKGESAPVVGMKRRRLGALLGADVSLLAYHLPLDAHPELGNNARLGQLLGIDGFEPLDPEDRQGVGNIGNLPGGQTASQFCRQIEALTGQVPLLIGEADARVNRVAWCTGAAQSYIDAAVAAGADLFLTGEVSEPTVHTAREEGIQFVAAGHHATERYGVQALGERLAQVFSIEHRFIDIANPV
ncbi:Nif3-like dinuclear metal center hexameric protein [Halioglobus sp. HI00S01]|uniref:Nif3-like dinuclear metal center hexameric protein n=1 Tax=Halioglobus sp. HI00S01 TaxID=1822214 RepID=UPI0007C38844|nr:Nif3-like dinuclear metal center hexameric protein [Halioglobus sp. HI00S01]KZX59515.1 Nif3-like dinuclear metal center hexameric protein [Halioglobus sp. HI00S01]